MDVSANHVRGQGSTLYLTFVSVVSALGGLLFGFDTVVISGTLSPLKAQWPMSAAMEGWLVGSALFGCMLGAAFAGSLSDRFGRKLILIFSGLLFTINSIGCGLAGSLQMLIWARFIGGVGVGLASMVSPLYISEISAPRLRGRMVTLFQFAITIGICIALMTNTWIEGYARTHAGLAGSGLWHWMMVDEMWRGMFFQETWPSIAFALLALIIPESPRFLTSHGRDSMALTILARVGGRAVAERELIEIKQAIVLEGEGRLSQLFQSGFRKALFVALFLAIVSELSGVTVILYYGPGILEKAGFTLGQSLGGFVSLGLVNVLFTVIALWLMDHWGRRPLLFWGNIGCFVALAIIGFKFMQGTQEGVLLVMMLCLFMACFAFSMGPIKWVVMSEIFPTRIRGRAMAIATMAVWLTDFAYNQAYPLVRERLGESGCFFIFAAVLVPQFLFVLFVMPETKGRTLEEIEQSWGKATVAPIAQGKPLAE
jgi:sugar porter (SP) family MFS transporter